MSPSPAADPLGPLAAAVAGAVRLELEELRGELAALRELLERPPRLLDRQGLADALGVSVRTLDTLRKTPGFPRVRVADLDRFELGAVLAFLRGRS